MAAGYLSIATIDIYRKNYPEAFKCSLTSLNLFKEIANKQGIGTAYHHIGAVLILLKEFKNAKEYLDSALTIGKDIGDKEIIKSAYQNMEQYDSAVSASGNVSLPQKAKYLAEGLDNYKAFINYRDSLKSEESERKLTNLQMTYDFTKRADSIKLAQDKKDAIAQADERRQKLIIGAVSIGLALVLVFFVVLLNRFRIIQGQKKLIEEQKQTVEKQKAIVESQKELVEEKNKDILDSIIYAKRLQDAILPPVGLIKSYLPDSFVLFLPKDIVAGDFYWVAPIPSGAGGGGLLIAACDCTGHGVPGALVSVVCSNALNRAVKEFHITEPGKILDKVRELVLETFAQKELPGIETYSNIQDGMDVSLAALTPVEGGVNVQWSGAFNSLWYMQDGIMKEIIGDKQAVGKTDNPKPFTTHRLTLSHPSDGRMDTGILYLLTDGFADQFGGSKGKKFKYRRLEEMLMSLATKPMAEQKAQLETEFRNWKGEMEQTDDVCIIGIRV